MRVIPSRSEGLLATALTNESVSNARSARVSAVIGGGCDPAGTGAGESRLGVDYGSF